MLGFRAQPARTCYGDPSAYGTLTLWNAQIHELYSSFKAHTKNKRHLPKASLREKRAFIQSVEPNNNEKTLTFNKLLNLNK